MIPPPQESSFISFCRHIQQKFTTVAAPKKNYRSLDFDRIKAIAAEAQRQLNDYSKGTEALSLRERVATYQELSEGLKKVADHINQSKSLWCQLISLFVYIPRYTEEGEKDLQKVLRCANRALKEVRRQEHRLWAGETWWLRGLDVVGLGYRARLARGYFERRNSSEAKVKAAAFRVLGKHLVKSRQLEGEYMEITLKNLQNDLKDFLEKYADCLMGAQKADLQSMGKNLSVAEAFLDDVNVMNVFANSSSWWTGESDKEVNLLKRTRDVCYSLRQKLEKLKPKESIIIPGRYFFTSGEGHAVMFEISKEPQGTYKLTIVDTGPGAGSSFGDATQRHDVGGRRYAYCLPGLSIEAVSHPDFMKELIQLNWQRDDRPAENMYKIILKYLAAGDANRVKANERHHLQLNGTCSHDCFTGWMEIRMGGPFRFHLFPSFTLHMTRRGLAQLSPANLKDHSKYIRTFKASIGSESIKGKALIEKIREYGAETLESQTKVVLEMQQKLKLSIEQSKGIRWGEEDCKLGLKLIESVLVEETKGPTLLQAVKDFFARRRKELSNSYA